MPSLHTPRLPHRVRQILERIADTLTAARCRRQAEAELRALDEHALRDLGLDRGAIAHAVRHGRAAG